MDAASSILCPAIAPIWGFAGVLAATVLSNMGAAYGTAKSGVGILKSGVVNPSLIWKNLIPVIMAGVNGIYGLIVAIIILNNISPPADDGARVYSLYSGFAHLGAGLCVGLASLISGMAIGIGGDAGVRAFTQLDYLVKFEPKTFAGKGKNAPKGGEQIFVAMVLIQVFSGNIALYGMITSIILTQTSYNCGQE
jgi:V-type H+-transporting ATPase proteolipid subunit